MSETTKFTNKVILNGETLIDLSGDDVKDDDVREGIKFHRADGSIGTGTFVPTSGGGDVTGECIIEVDDLPTGDDINKDAIYKVKNTFSDVILATEGTTISMKAIASTNGGAVSFHTISNKDAQNIRTSTASSNNMHLYYILDESMPEDIYTYIENTGWVKLSEQMTSTSALNINSENLALSNINIEQNTVSIISDDNPFSYIKKIYDISEIDEDGYYALMSDGYFKYIEGGIVDIIDGSDCTPILTYLQMIGCTVQLFHVTELPSDDDIVVSDLSTLSLNCYFYDSNDENAEVYLYIDGTGWVTFGNALFGGYYGGKISDVSQITDSSAYYILITPSGLQQLIPESEAGSYGGEAKEPSITTLTVEPKTYSNTYYPSSYSADYFSEVTVGAIPNDYYRVSGTLIINKNGTKDVKQYESVDVNVPATYIVNTLDNLPSDACDGSIAIILGGE